MVTHTISWPELTWTIISFMGFIFCARVALRATIQLLSLRALRINSMREYAAVTTVIAFTSWTTVQAFFTLIGAVAMSVVNPTPLSLTQYTILALFVAGSVSLSWAAYVVDKRRIELKQKIEAIEKNAEDGNPEYLWKEQTSG